MKKSLNNFLDELIDFFVFSIEAFKHLPENIINYDETLKNVVSIGVESFFIVVMTGFFFGMVMGMQLAGALDSIIAGSAQYISGGIAMANLKEIGPVLTSLIVVSRVCSSVTAHIGTMKVTEQIDALKTFSVNPIEFLVTPRLLAGMISLPLLGFFSILASMIGGWIMVAFISNIPSASYLQWAQYTIKLSHVYEAFFKLVIMGAFLLLISTYYGFKTKGGAEGVGNATIKSVVVSSFTVILLDYVIGAVVIFIKKSILR